MKENQALRSQTRRNAAGRGTYHHHALPSLARPPAWPDLCVVFMCVHASSTGVLLRVMQAGVGPISRACPTQPLLLAVPVTLTCAKAAPGPSPAEI